MSKYYQEVLPDVQQNARKARRIGWPQGQYIQSLPASEIDIKVGDKTLEPSSTLVLVRKGKKGLLGYAPEQNERTCKDWELIPA